MGQLGLGLFYVGFVLIINAIWLLGKTSAKSVIPMNLFVAGVQIAGVLTIIFTSESLTDFYVAAATLLFTFTYLHVAINNAFDLDGHALGWYCVLVVIFAVPAGLLSLPDVGLLILWWMWATLWFAFFLLLALDKNILRPTAWWTLVNGIVTGVAAYFILIGLWPW
jgi:hypothetical protein